LAPRALERSGAETPAHPYEHHESKKRRVNHRLHLPVSPN
jgi:hypothetical protein